MELKPKMEFIRHPGLPEDIWLGARYREVRRRPQSAGKQTRLAERAGGRLLVGDIVAAKVGEARFEIDVPEDRKPRAVYDGQKIHISISHCRSMICGAVSRGRELGVDVEPVARPFHPGLKNRILHPDEAMDAGKVPVLQLWTVKEASLKWSGSGLRTAMNRIRTLAVNEFIFEVELQDGRGLFVCSFDYKKHWISLAYEGER